MFANIILSVIILSILLFMMSITLIFFKNRKFPSSHIGNNQALKEKGIECALSQDKKEQRDNRSLE